MPGTSRSSSGSAEITARVITCAALLVPTAMTLLGSHAWWTPGRLDRMLPHVDPEGGEPD